MKYEDCGSSVIICVRRHGKLVCHSIRKNGVDNRISPFFIAIQSAYFLGYLRAYLPINTNIYSHSKSILLRDDTFTVRDDKN